MRKRSSKMNSSITGRQHRDGKDFFYFGKKLNR